MEAPSEIETGKLRYKISPCSNTSAIRNLTQERRGPGRGGRRWAPSGCKGEPMPGPVPASLDHQQRIHNEWPEHMEGTGREKYLQTTIVSPVPLKGQGERRRAYQGTTGPAPWG